MKMSGIEEPNPIKHEDGDHSFLETMPYRKDSAQDRELLNRFGRVSVIGANLKAIEVVEYDQEPGKAQVSQGLGNEQSYINVLTESGVTGVNMSAIRKSAASF